MILERLEDLIIDSPTNKPFAPAFIILFASRALLIPLSAILNIPLGTNGDIVSKFFKSVFKESRFLLFIPNIFISAFNANSSSFSSIFQR